MDNIDQGKIAVVCIFFDRLVTKYINRSLSSNQLFLLKKRLNLAEA
jgi:hypothetical protein